MSVSGNINEKDEDDPCPRYLHHCKKYELTDNAKSSDRLSASLPLKQSDIDAVGAGYNDTVHLYVESGDRWLLAERDVYSDRAGVGLNSSLREELNLSQENRTVEIWLNDPEDAEYDLQELAEGQSENQGTDQDSNTDDEVSTDTNGQKSSETDNKIGEYVWFPRSKSGVYHIAEENGVTKCGIDITDKESQSGGDPGDMIDKCQNCSQTTQMSNEELVEWLGNEVGFVPTGDNPAYLTKTQLNTIKRHIVSLKN